MHSAGCSIRTGKRGMGLIIAMTIFHRILFLMVNGQWPSIGLDNDLVPNRRQAIICTNADRIHRRIHAALGCGTRALGGIS